MFREGGHTTALISDGRRRVRTEFDDGECIESIGIALFDLYLQLTGSELVEEYHAASGELLCECVHANASNEPQLTFT